MLTLSQLAKIHSIVLAICLSATGCAEFPLLGDSNSSLDASINRQLERTCPIPAVAEDQKLRLRVVRAQIILAAIAGYANTSILNYSSASDIKADTLLVIERLKYAQGKLQDFSEAVEIGNNLSALYRADLIIAAGDAADAALRPTYRTVKTTLFSPSLSLDKVKRSKQLLLNILKDKVYLDAIEVACLQLNPQKIEQQWDFASERYSKRCASLAENAKLNAADECKKLAWVQGKNANIPKVGSSILNANTNLSPAKN